MSEEEFDINFKVNRLIHVNEESEEDSGDDDDDDDEKDEDPDFSNLWRHNDEHPLYVIILGG